MAKAFFFHVVDLVHNSRASDSLFFPCRPPCGLSRLLCLRHLFHIFHIFQIFHLFHLFQNPQKQKRARPKTLKSLALCRQLSLRHPFSSCVLQTSHRSF